MKLISISPCAAGRAAVMAGEGEIEGAGLEVRVAYEAALPKRSPQEDVARLVEQRLENTALSVVSRALRCVR